MIVRRLDALAGVNYLDRGQGNCRQPGQISSAREAGFKSVSPNVHRDASVIASRNACSVSTAASLRDRF